MTPPGLMPVRIARAGGNKQNASANSNKRTRNLIRPTSPKSPGASVSAFESVDGSNDEDTLLVDAKLDDAYLQTNGDLGPGSLFQTLPDVIAVNGDSKPLAASSSMIRSHRVSGDLHGVQPDPIVADILRKKPEQDTFVRMKISPMAFFCTICKYHEYPIYTGGDIKRSGELGKMIDIHVEKSRKSGPIPNAPSRNASFSEEKTGFVQEKLRCA